MKFSMPAKLDIHYKFLGGALDFKQLGYRLIGLPLAIVATVLIITITGSEPWGIVLGTICIIAGWFIGSRKVFDHTMPLLKAIMYDYQLSHKSKVLINYRQAEDFHDHRGDKKD